MIMTKTTPPPHTGCFCVKFVEYLIKKISHRIARRILRVVPFFFV